MVRHQLFMMKSLALLFFLRTYVFAECNVCSLKTNVACVSEFNFALCSNGIPSSQSYKCPDGKACSTVGESICQDANDANTVKACQDCFKCDETLTFACTGVKSFALCLGTNNYSALFTGTCDTNTFCSIDNPHICGTSADFFFATCPQQELVPTPAPTTSTTTPAPTPPPIDPLNPSTYCQYIQETGRYPMGSNLTTTCHQYIRCYYISSVWKGASYVCPGNSYFDSSRKVCTIDIPPRCASKVSSFSLLNLNLD